MPSVNIGWVDSFVGIYAYCVHCAVHNSESLCVMYKTTGSLDNLYVLSAQCSRVRALKHNRCKFYSTLFAHHAMHNINTRRTV